MASLPTTLADGRYKVLANISDIRDVSYIDEEELQTLVVQDTQSSKYATARLAKQDTRSYTRLNTHLEVLKRLGVQGPHEYVLAPIDTFEHTSAGAKYLAVVYEELLGPDLNALDSNGGDENNFHEPEVIRNVGSQTAHALDFLHKKNVAAGLSTASPVLTYPNLAKADSDAILKFYGHDGEVTNFNESATGPANSPFNKSALLYKVDRIDPSASYATNYVPEEDFGGGVGAKSDLWILGSILFNLANQTSPDIHTINHATSEAADKAVESLDPSPAKGLITTIELIGDLPAKYVDQFDDDARALVQKGAVKFDKDAVYKAVKNNRPLADLLLQLLAHDPEKRIEAGEALKSAYFQ
ncbi:hypothetical protein K461DRAFT_291740 [Myriangium duriaei CBS 260.36]|uniref:Protein kinase domain-containing protein n=1 Tax=Myriangium duriaei CBS 260.36 TaxID=1168546 RepID=A0A9P4J4A8_9PEZI|nr:hypothetical protein K461DRAFT_291740 [Myriangium duriaei CBS 260.36]